MNGKVVAVAAVVVAGVVGAVLALPLVLILMVSSSSSASAACGPGGVFAGGPLRVPIVGRFTVTSEYGMRYDPVFLTYQLHAGIDLASSSPAPIVAMSAGRVTFAGNAGTAGNMVVIDHGGAVTTRSMHMASLTVRTGEAVVAGQQIGIEGTTGASTGMHLHFEIRSGGASVNPRTWLGQNGVTLPPLNGWGEGPGAGGAPTGTGTATPSSSSTSSGPSGIDPSGAMAGMPLSSCAGAMGPLNAAAVPAEFAPWIAKAGTVCAQIPAPIIAAQIEAESGFNPHAVSSSGAQGASQFMPGTWATIGRDDDGNGKASPFDIGDAVMAQARYDCQLAAQLRGRVAGDLLANTLAAYNAGPGAVMLHNGIPPFPETENYVARIQGLASKYTQSSTASSTGTPR